MPASKDSRLHLYLSTRSMQSLTSSLSFSAWASRLDRLRLVIISSQSLISAKISESFFFAPYLAHLFDVFLKQDIEFIALLNHSFRDGVNEINHVRMGGQHAIVPVLLLALLLLLFLDFVACLADSFAAASALVCSFPNLS